MDQEAALFKVLAEPTRLRLATLLAMAGETCVCQLAQAIEEPEYKVSRHLGIMALSRTGSNPAGGNVDLLSLCKPVNALEACLQNCFEVCFTSHPVTAEDMQRLRRSACGPSAKTQKN